VRDNNFDINIGCLTRDLLGEVAQQHGHAGGPCREKGHGSSHLPARTDTAQDEDGQEVKQQATLDGVYHS